MAVYKCPVCEGRGILPADFYHIYESSSVSSAVFIGTEPCRSCGGRGIVFDTIQHYGDTETFSEHYGCLPYEMCGEEDKCEPGCAIITQYDENAGEEQCD